MENRIPAITRLPILALRIPAAASAPGCVGIKQCTERKEHPKTPAINGIAVFVLALNDFARPLRMINPESAKIDIPAMKPVMPKAATAFLSPVFDKINLANVIAAPVTSRMIAITAPSIIRKPVDAIVLPKASFMMLITFLPGITAIARNNDTRKSEINALSFHFEVSKMMASILMITTIDTPAVFMF